MIGEQLIKIELSEADAKLFLDFQKNYETFSTLLQAGVFNIKNGNAVVNFDRDGILREISLHTVGYKRGQPFIVAIKA
jgi:hypothetical protein